MERLLVKTGIYSFIASFLLMFVFVSRENQQELVSGSITIIKIGFGDYFFMIARYSVMIMLVAVVLTFIGKKMKENE